MALRDLHNSVGVANSIDPAAHTATVEGKGVDTRGYDSCEVVVACGTVTDGTHVISLEESDDNVDANYSAVASADLLGSAPTLSSSNEEQAFRFGYRGGKRYVRVISTVSGATTGGVYGAVVEVSHAHETPTDDPTAATAS